MRYLAAVWFGSAAVVALLLWVASYRHDAWFLLLAVAVLLVPVVATGKSVEWLGRTPRKRWKRHDVEDELARAAREAR
jgi:hypothetical protein